jgi:hypothetical protein
MGGSIEVTGRRRGRSKKLVDNLRKRKGTGDWNRKN